MPVLRAVPGPADEAPEPEAAEPVAVALAPAALAPAALAPAALAPAALAPAALDAAETDSVPVRWFSCAGPGVGAVVRAHVLTVLNAWVVDTDSIADAMVLVSELVTNVRDHTASDSLGVRVSLTAERVVVAVVEHEDVDAPPDGTGHLRHDRGRGLRILDAVASEWGFVRAGDRTTTWFALTTDAGCLREPDVHRF